MLHLYDTFTRQKKLFKPVQPGKVSLYVCGMTVYDYCHIGHGRLFVVFDMIVRYLRYCGYRVTYVCNITDIDDKIISRANENKENYAAFVQHFIDATHQDQQALHILPPTFEPRATEFISQMITMIKILLQKKYAYVAENGDVYYHVSHFKEYGELAHQDLQKLQAGARVEVADVKKEPLDFVLWKKAKPDEPSWDSPWGKGRPGWHIECSAMAAELLGMPFDLHGGGLDLVFPHHENEIAQAEAAENKKFVNTWLHMGYVQVNQEKMSKSLNNFTTLRDALKLYSTEVIRYFMLASHYRSPINYSIDNLQSAEQALTRLYTALYGIVIPDNTATNVSWEEKFKIAMDDDLNTPEAFAVLFDLTREINRCKEQNESKVVVQLAMTLKKLAALFGILQENPEKFLQRGVNTSEIAWIEKLIDDRKIARQQKNWAEADRIRQRLLDKNIVLEDAGEKTVWKYQK